MIWQIVALILLLIGMGVLLTRLRRALVNLFITFQGPFFAPTSDERIHDLLSAVRLKPTQKIVDLGSGDGRVLIALVKKYGVAADGYEIDPDLVKESRERIAKAKLSKKITIHDRSFWDANLSKYDLIVVYCVPRFLKKLEQKLTREMKSSAKVASVFFRFPTWKPRSEVGDIRLYGKRP